jgi:cellulose synthase/poly-beta-1,6-N-acetylglucosamine synthase-like glycosyltransferase
MMFFALIPTLIFAILVINAIIAAFLATLYAISVFIKPKPLPSPVVDPSYTPFISVHLPCHNEAFPVVQKTLDSLAALNYKNYEVIVIDNNTTNPALWKPLKNYCRTLGPKFRFFHFEKLAGFKAGALNAATRIMNPKTQIVAIVDADYEVYPDFLQNSAHYFTDPLLAFVQYPQAYYNSDSSTVGMEYEYRSHFDNILEQAQSWGAATLTGTMCLMRASLFKQNSLKWNEWCITEDTEIGIHLQGSGYKGLFINLPMGRGLMPFNFYSLRRQRERWVHGNWQIIQKNFLPLLKNRHLSWKQKISFISQLTSWIHPNLLPLTALSISLIWLAFFNVTRIVEWIAWLSLITILGFILARTYSFAIGLARRNIFSMKRLIFVTLSHFGLTITMSTAWLRALTKQNLGFNRTSKDPSEPIGFFIPPDAVGGICVLTAALVLFIAGGTHTYVLATFTAMLGIFFLMGWWTITHQTNMARRIASSTLSPANDGTIHSCASVSLAQSGSPSLHRDMEVVKSSSTTSSKVSSISDTK